MVKCALLTDGEPGRIPYLCPPPTPVLSTIIADSVLLPPFTWRGTSGESVPIPTSPPVVIRIRSVFEVKSVRGVALPVPLIVPTLPRLPVKSTNVLV